MRSFSKIISILLIFILCLNVYGGSVFSQQNTADSGISEALELLRFFDIIPDYYDYNTPFDKEVSRAEFADAAARLINMSDYKGNAVHYYDVPKSHFAYNSICALTEMGVIRGTGEHIFDPDEPIEDAAAYKIILSLMGYSDYAMYNGGYPHGFLNAAMRAEIYTASDNATITHSEMFEILYNALTAKVLVMIACSTDGSYTVTDASEDETLLSLYYDIYNDKGILQGAECISLTDRSLDDRNEALINGVLYKTELNLTEYLGEEVEFFYKKNSREDDRTLLWAKRSGKSDVLSITVDNDASFNPNTYTFTYSNNNKNTSITLDRKMILIYNGCVVGENYGSVLNLPRLEAKFIKNGSVFDIVIVRAYENYVVDIVDTTKKVVYDRTDAKKSLKLDENSYDYLSIKRADGTELTIPDIKQNDVLSAFLSKDKSRLAVIVETNAKAGVVDSVRKNSSGTQIDMDDTVYYLPNGAFAENFSAGDSVKLYLDYTGCVAAVYTEAGSEFAAYVAGIAKDELFGTKLRIKMFMQDGTLAVYECADKLIVDGKAQATAADVEAALMNTGKVKPQLILAEVNSKGIVRSIETAAANHNGGENLLKPNLALEERTYKIQGYFNFEAAIDDNTIIFGVPSDSLIGNADEDDFRIIKKSELQDDTRHMVMTFNTKEIYGYEQYAVIIEDSTNLQYGQDLPVLVTNKGQTTNADGDTVEYIEGYQGKVKTTVASNGQLSFSDIKPGMLVRFLLARDGGAVNREILFDPEKPQAYYTQTAPFNNVYGVEVGFVNNIVGDVIKIGYGSGANINHVSNMYNQPAILVYDIQNEKNPAAVGSFGDAKRYYNVGDNCSRVVLITKHCTPRLYVFYNNITEE